MEIVKKIKLLFFLVTLTLPAFSHAQAPGNGHPFRSSEIVVSGDPSTLPSGVKIVKYLPHANLTVIAAEKGKEFGLVQKYRLKGRRAGLNYIATASEVNDLGYDLQWNFPLVQSDDAWSITTGAEVRVAVLDTGLAVDGAGDGVNKCDEDGYNAVSNDAPLDGNGHGTHVSGTIAQKTNNINGVAGLAHNACIIPVKVLDDTGSGSFADIADGISFAVLQKVDVINMSLGSNARYNIVSDPIMDDKLLSADTAGVVVVCAAGNDSWRKNVSYPASYPTTVAVGATGYGGSTVRYSNYGEGLDIMAPGGNLLVDSDGDGYGDGILQETLIDDTWGYYYFQGTSMAAPHVSAVAALIISYKRSQGIEPSSQDIREIIEQSALDLGDPGYDTKTGWGLVQAYDALGTLCVENPEVCDGIDNNCDGVIDEGCSVCIDDDDDAYCTPEDCNDGNPDINPGVIELCDDDIDNNCDGVVDEGCSAPICLARGEECSPGVECCSGCHPRKGTCK